jgi:hypothetical protein
MNGSNLPQGTVFIVVGAILGSFGAAVLIWRAVVGCLLHRSVKRAALAQQMDKSSSFGGGPRSMSYYKYTDHDSFADLGAIYGHGHGRVASRAQKSKPMSTANPSQSNLFFSPTAAGGGAGANQTHNRSSSFLPSGFYAAGQGAPQQGQRGRSGSTHSPSISLTDLRPDSRGRQMNHSPDVSPGLAARHHDALRQNLSTSTLNLPGARAPSTYLDDLLDDQPGPWNQPR